MADARMKKLAGPVISLPTFTDDNHNQLLDRQRKHIRWLLDHGLQEGSGVLLIAGGYGESYFLEDAELFALIDVLMEEAGGKVATMVGIFDLSARIAARKAKYAGDAGIDFIELGMPHYSAPSEEDVFLFHRYVNDHADVGIMSYNNFWVMPPPSYEMSQSLIARLVDLEHFDGIKWSSGSEEHYVGMLREFGDRINFIDNGMKSALGARNGMKGFVDFYGNVAPRLSMKVWDLFKSGQHDELDELLYKTHVKPAEDLDTPDAPAHSGMGDGPFGKVRWELLGLHSGPVFPAQAPVSDAVREHTRKVIEAGGLMEWVDWDQSVLE